MQTSSPASYESPATTEDAIMGLLLVLGRRMRGRMAEDSLDFSLVPILKVLAHCGAMRLSALAATLELDASTVSRHVKQLEDRGLLERTSDPDDGRASQIACSGQGEAALAEHFGRRVALISTVLDSWGPQDREALRSLLDRFNRQIADASPALQPAAG
jgi:DNA-binding MarR family transcriptional regulator